MMNLIRQNRRLCVLVFAIALLGGIAAWRLSGTAQAHRARNVASRPLAGDRRRAPQVHRRGSGPGQPRIQPGGPMLGAACFVIKAGFDGSPVRIVPVDSPRPALQDCRPVCAGGSPGKAHALEIFGGSFREAPPAEPWRTIAHCGSVRLPPGYVVPLGH